MVALGPKINKSKEDVEQRAMFPYQGIDRGYSEQVLDYQPHFWVVNIILESDISVGGGRQRAGASADIYTENASFHVLLFVQSMSVCDRQQL